MHIDSHVPPPDGVYHLERTDIESVNDNFYIHVRNGRIIYASNNYAGRVQLGRTMQDFLNRVERSNIWKLTYVGKVWRTRTYNQS